MTTNNPAVPGTAGSPGEMYRAAEPHLKRARKHYQKSVKELLLGQVPEHYVLGRVKSARSLIRKLRERPSDPRTWESITDKVGVRVICTTKADCDKATELIENGPWTVRKKDRKKPETHDHLFYPGIHLDIEAPDIVDHTGASILCEVQVRTRAQDAWAVASHRLTYKGAIRPPESMQRLVVRLTVFVEVFDDEIHRLFKKRARLPLFAEALLLEHLEIVFEEVSGEPAETATDLSIIAILMDAYDVEEKADIRDLIDTFCETREDLPDLVKAHGFNTAGYNDDADWLYTQPEVLIVLERAHAKRYRLLSAVRNTDLEAVVRATCISAGVPLPEE